jgi:hypothetical protein
LARSSSNAAWLDRLALGGIALGLSAYVLPVWSEGRLRWAFWITFLFTVLHVFTSHQAPQSAGKS